MHKRGFFGSKQQAILSPLIDLISFRSKLSSNHELLNQIESKLLSNVPSLENKEISKLSKNKTPSDVFHRAAPKYKFDSSILYVLSSDEFQLPADDGFTVITCYQFFAWLYYDSKKGDNENNIHLFIICLLKIVNSPIQSSINYAFSEIMNYIANNSAFKFHDQFCSDLIRYFEFNLTLESNLFPLFLNIIKKILGIEKHISNALNMIDNLVIKKAPIIGIQDSESLIVALQQHIQSLDPSALHVLALLSANTTESSLRISDSFVLIINAVVQNITSSPLVYIIKTTPNDENNNFSIIENEIISRDKKDLIFLRNFEFLELFKELPFKLINSKKSLFSFMSPQTRDTCKMIRICIKSSNQTCKITFAKMFLFHLQITESTKFEAFTELAAAFFTLCKDFGSVELLHDSFLPTLSKSIIFNPTLHIFLETPLDPAINAFRESSIEMIHIHCPEDIFDFLKQLKSKTTNYLFLYVEMLVRILNHKSWFPLKFTQNKNNFYITLMEISRQLQSLNMKYSNSSSAEFNMVVGARNALMIFISNLLNDPLTAPSYISSQTFIHGFFWLIFEPTLTYTVLHTICESISKMYFDFTNKGTFNNFLNFSVAVINSCRHHYREDIRYENLAKSFSHEIINALYLNPLFSLYFVPILPPFLNLVIEFPEKEILSEMLVFLNLIASTDLQFQLPGFLLRLFYKAINKVEGNDISRHTENMLFSLLKRSVCSQSDAPFFITIPSALPLLFAVFGFCEKNSERVVNLIHNLCTYSDYNKIMCHDGEVDLILIQYACSRLKNNGNVVIQYHGCEFNLVFSKDVFRNYVLPLISMISNSKSDVEDSHYFIDHLVHSEDPELCVFLTQLVVKRQAVPNPLFSIGSDFVQFSVDGIRSNDFESSGFTISFMMNIDKEYLKEKDNNLIIIKFRDTNNITFTIYLNQFSLYAKQESDTIRTIVNVVKSIPGSKWVNITLAVSFTQEAVLISNYMNNKKLPDSELSPFFFAPGEIKVTVGGIEKDEILSSAYPSTQNDWRNQQFALIGGIKLIKGVLSAEDIPKIQGKNSFSILIDSNIIKQPYCQSVYSKPRDDVVNTGLFGKTITDIVINSQPAPSAPQTLVDIFVKRNDCCKLAYYFSHISEFKNETDKKSLYFCGYPAMIIGLINEFFKKDIECQMSFNQNYINIILGSLFKNPKILNANLYFAFYDVLKSIKYKPLIKPWFDSFILNTWLWSLCDYKEYYDIIMHYSHVLIVDYKYMFKENSYFSSLFNQTMLLFALDDEGKHETSITDVPPLLNSTYNEKAIFHCQDLFLVFLARIGTINLNEMDVASIIAHVSGWKTKSTLIKLLKMVFDISATLINVQGYENNCIPCIQSLIRLTDVDIFCHALVILPELVKENRINYLISAAFRVIKYENKEQIFNQMLKRLSRSPSQYVFLSILSLDIQGDSAMKLANELDHVVLSNGLNYKMNFEPPLMWFLFPLLLAFHCEDSVKEKICKFIAFILSKQNKKNFEKHCNMVFSVTALISILTKLWNTKVPFYLIKSLSNCCAKENIDCIVQNAICIAFFKAISFEKESVLLKEFRKSEFCDDPNFKIEDDQQIPSFTSISESKDPVFMMRFLATNDTKLLLKVRFVLELFLSEKGSYHIKHLPCILLDYAYKLMLMSKSFTESEIKVIKYFASLYQCERRSSTSSISAISSSSNSIDSPTNSDSKITPPNSPRSARSEKSDSNMIDTFNAMAEADEVFDKYREIYQERLYSCINDAQKELQAIETFISQNQTASLTDDMSCIAECQMKAEYKCHLDNIPNEKNKSKHAMSRSMFDQTLCSFCCPFKVKAITPLTKKKENPEPLELLFEHSAFLLSFNKSPLPVNFCLSKKFILIRANSKTRIIKLSSILYIFPRCQGNGLEFICKNGKSYLLNFQTDFPQIQKALNGVKFPKCRIFIHNESMSPATLQKRWLSDRMSNFEYIIKVNMIAGRSFRDRSIYPIFPSILRDYNDITSVKTSFEKFRLSEGKSDIKVDFIVKKGIKESFNEFDFVRADYFFRPESIDYVPKSWAKDKFDVVYKLRNLLETPEITSILHKWINNCFKKYSSRFLNLQTFRSDHIQHPPITSSVSKARELSMVKKIDMNQVGPSGNIIAASTLTSTAFLVLSSSGMAYYVVLANKDAPLTSSSLNESIINSQNIQITQSEDNDTNHSILLQNPPSTPPSSPVSPLSGSLNLKHQNDLIVNVYSSFRAQQIIYPNIEEDVVGNSILNLNTISSLSDRDENNSSGNGGMFGSNVSRRSIGSDSGFENDFTSIKRSGSSRTGSLDSFGSVGSLGGLNSFSSTNSINVNLNINAMQEHFLQDASFGFSRGKIAWYLPDENKVRIIGNEKVINEETIFPELQLIACCNNDIYFCSSACTISVISPSKCPVPICSTKSRITALVADETFHIIVVGTEDGFIHIFRTYDGGLVKTIDLSIDKENPSQNYEERYKEIRKILITSNWGLIVVNIFGKIKTFSVNGTHVMDIELNDPILKWFAYTSNKSFDFVVFENAEHKIGIFDPLKKDSVKYFYETMEPLPLISFISSINAFVFLSESKQITLVPHP